MRNRKIFGSTIQLKKKWKSCRLVQSSNIFQKKKTPGSKPQQKCQLEGEGECGNLNWGERSHGMIDKREHVTKGQKGGIDKQRSGGIGRKTCKGSGRRKKRRQGQEGREVLSQREKKKRGVLKEAIKSKESPT